MNPVELPAPLALPLKLVPGRIHSTVVSRLLNLLLSSQRAQGELDFLDGKTLRIDVEDAGLSYSISLRNQLLVAAGSTRYDISISGKVHDFLQLMARIEDTDTLFFQRRLKMQGDTELGLYLKNFLDGLDIETLPFYRLGRPLLDNGIRLLERIGQRENPHNHMRGV
jgi:predicted lipid carrier protein YhbT